MFYTWWFSQLERKCTQSCGSINYQADYIAVIEAAKEGMLFKGFLSVMGREETVIVYCDSQSALHLIKNHMFHERSKHIKISYIT